MPQVSYRPWATILLIVACIAANPGIIVAGSSTESFGTTFLRDDTRTTADWNTAAGELRHFPFAISPAGSYNTPGFASNVAVAGDHAYVADGTSGLQVIDISDPTAPTLAGSLPVTGVALGVALAGNFAYVAEGASGLRVVDISDPLAPVFVTLFPTIGPVSDVKVAGNHAYVAGGTTGIEIIDVTDPSAPSSLGSHDTPGDSREVALFGDLLLVADRSGGLQVVDVSDPTAPVLAGSFNTQGDSWGVAAAGSRAFVADLNDGILVLDITDPSLPDSVGALDTPGQAFGVVPVGDRLFVADASVGGLLSLDITDPTNPTLLHAYDTGGTARKVVVEGEFAYLADGTRGLQILRIALPSTPTVIDNYRNLATENTDVAVSGDIAVLATGGSISNNKDLQFLDISDLTDIRLLSTFTEASLPRAVDVAGHYAYVADGGSGLRIVDFSDPTAPTTVGLISSGGSAVDVVVEGDLVHVADRNALYRIFDVSDPANPVIEGALTVPGSVECVAVAGHYAFLGNSATTQTGVKVIDISDPANPVQVGEYPTTQGILHIDISGDLAAVAVPPNVEFLDISTPTSPQLIGSYTTDSGVRSVDIEGNRAYIAAFVDGLRVVDITDPANPDSVALIGDFAYGVTVEGHYVHVGSGFNTGYQVIRVWQDEADTDNSIGHSSAIDSAVDTIYRARVSPQQTGEVLWSLTADLATYDPALPGSWIKLRSPSTNLFWRAELSYTLSAPVVDAVTVDWLNAFSPIETVADVPGDQGGWARVTFTRSAFDFADEDSLPISGYQVYRRIDDALVQAQVRAQGRSPAMDGPTLTDFDENHVRVWNGRRFVSAATSFPPGTWEIVATALPTQSDAYTVTVPTVADSGSVVGMPFSVFLVTAHTTTPSIWFVSDPDSGYSVDNIAPGVPSGFAANYGAGMIDLFWDPAPEADFQYFRVYRSTDPGFVPGPGTLVHQTAATSWQDSPSNPGAVFYKITALDHAGNESVPASSGSVTGVDDRPAAPAMFALRRAVPNPLRVGTRIAFDLPVDAEVSLEVFDVTGRRVRTLAREALPAGAHEIAWDGRDDSGHSVAVGVYLYRLRAGQFEAARRVVVIR
jgi:hypothetical protein